MQTLTQHGARRRLRTVWISDVHLGYHAARADYLLEFLHSVECEYLYLVGDIVDLWQIKRRPFWPQQHNDVVRTILGMARHGTRVIYVPGNHDEVLRAYAEHDFGNIAIRERAVHTRASGERLLVIHGDQFDAAVASSRWVGQLGAHAYDWLLAANVALNAVRRRCGFPYWSLAGFLKHKVKNAVQYISRFEAVVAEAAAREGVDGVVCGHIHRPEITTIDGIGYYNCGDWVESCTALVEQRDGRIELVEWQRERGIVRARAAAA
ncbi:MAG: UDP-2,3-diacylglucosamine diphosphatase [Gammaproteobacteria bacterium]